MNRLGLAVAILSVFVALLSCGNDEGPAGPGKVEIKWKLANTTCDAAGIIEVEVRLLQDGQKVASASPRCEQGKFLFEEVPAGTYDVELLGKDAKGDPWYEGFYTGLVVKEGDVPSTPDTAIVLTLRKGGIKLAWSFPPDISTCGFAGVAQVEVNILKASDNDVLFSQVYDCNIPAEQLEGTWLVVRELPLVEVKVVMFGLDVNGERISQGSATATISPKADPEVKIILEPCEGGVCV